MNHRTMLSLSFAAILALSPIAVQAAQEVRVGGGGAAMGTIFDPIVTPLQKATGIALSRRPSTPANGLMDLVNGRVDLAAAAVPLESMIAGAAKNGVTVDPAKLVKEQIGTNRTVLLVNPANKVGKLTREQIKGIFTGKIANWKDVGGDDMAIIVVWGIGTPGQNAMFVKEVLGGEAVTRESLESTNYLAIKDTVASTPEAIGIDPFGVADAAVRTIDCDPELTSPIIAVTMGKPSADVRKVIDYIKGEGRQYTKQ